MNKRKRLKTKRMGDYAIKTFMLRGELLDWLEAQKNESDTIRIALKRMMDGEKK